MKKILYVEDNLDNFRLVKALLESRGYKVFGAEDGLTAIAKAEDIKPDLILMDIAIPGLDGFEVTTRLKSTGELSSIPIVAISAKVSKKNRDMAFAVGCVDFIPKPIDPFNFPDKIGALLEGKRNTVKQREVFDKEVFKELSKKMVSSLEAKVNQLTEVNIRLKISEKKYKSLIENVNVGIWFFSKNGKTIFLNSRMKEILEFKGITPVSIRPFLSNDEFKKFKKHLQGWESGKSNTFTLVIKTPNKREKHLVASGTFVQTEMAGEEGYLISFLDITERKSLEEQLLQMQKLESMAILTAGVAHDFNNILSIIKANLDLIYKRGNLDIELKSKINNIFSAVERGVNITRSLLIFSRKVPVNFEVVNLKKELKDFIVFFKNYKKKGIDVIYELDEVPPVYADKNQIGQILLNLATNSQDAMENGGEIRFYLTSKRVDDPEILDKYKIEKGEYALIKVEDTGSGIPKDVLDKIFEPLFTTKEPGKGTGLGLSTVYGIVKKHGGFIEVKSEVGVGTTFFVYLPLYNDKEEEEIEVDEDIDFHNMNYKAVLLEDEPSIREFLEECLSDFGISVTSFSKFEEFRDFFTKDKSHDIYFIDFSIVGSNNIELLENFVKEKGIEHFVFTSGYSFENICEKIGSDFEIKFFMKKPFDIKDIKKFLLKVLKQ